MTLLPCPFCGGLAYIVTGEECAYVQCEDVKMHRALWFDGDNAACDEVAEQWNRREERNPSPFPEWGQPKVVGIIEDATPEALAASPEVAKLVAEAEARGWNNGMRIATSHVAEIRNTQEPGAVFAALNEAMGRIEGARFAAIRRAAEGDET